MLRPGITITIRSVESDADRLYFYVNRVEHLIDVAGKTARTSLTGNFYRDSAGVFGDDGTTEVISAKQIKEGIESKLYYGFRGLADA